MSPARLFPEATDGMPSFGREAGGALRVMKEGRRFLVRPDGGIECADAPGLASWTMVDAVPQRLGGGFLFRDRKGAPALYRAESWLAPAKAFHTNHTDVAEIWFGVDRMYLTSANGSRIALDPSGAQLDAGALPSAPHVRSLVALDGWNALAITEGRGVLVSRDAGATWQDTPLPIDPTLATVGAGVFRVQGASPDGRLAAYLVRRDGTYVEERPTPEVPKPPPKPPGVFGTFPLARAIASGIALDDGTAVVAKDGTLGRVRLADGVVVEKHDAFDMRSASCNPMPLSPNDATPRRWGFVCGEPKGRTVIYGLENSALKVVRAFATPRAVFASGEGGFAVRGACDEESGPSVKARRAYCVFHPKTGFREIVLTGNVGAERVIVLGDGRVAVLTPPAFDLTTARLTIIDQSGSGKTVPVTFPDLNGPAAPLLASALWLDGFELRDLDRIGGWVAAGPTVLGIEIGLDGKGRIGEHIIDVGNPVVSGKFGLGWSSSGRGFETVDGGFSWQPIDMPQPIADGEKNPERSCSALGCRMHGWIRVGWGASDAQRPSPLPAARMAERPTVRPLQLACEGEPDKTPGTTAPSLYRIGTSSVGKLIDTPADLGAFRGLVGPTLKKSDRAYVVDATGTIGRQNPRPEARLFAVGPKSTLWEEQNVTFMMEWASPFDARAHASGFAPAPSVLVEAGRTITPPTGGPRRYSPSYFGGGLSITVASDSKHALASVRRQGQPGFTVYALSEERPPMEVKRTDGEPWSDVDDAVFADRTWFITSTASNSPLTTASALPVRMTPTRSHARLSIFRVDGAAAREIAVVRRPQNKYGITTLIHEYGGHRVGVLMEGDPPPGAYLPALWVTPVDPESGQTGDPEPLATTDLSDVPELRTCDDPARGWLWNATIGGRRSEAHSSTATTPIGAVNVRALTGSRGTCIQSMAFTSKDIALSGPLKSRPNTVITREGRAAWLSCRGEPR